MSPGKSILEDFWGTLGTAVFGAGFIKEGVDVKSHPGLITFDGHSAYFYGLKEREAKKLLEGVTMLNGYTGWLAYILQDIFFDEGIEEDLYGEIFDGLYSGMLQGPAKLSRESIFQWVESAAPQVEKIKSRLSSRLRDIDVPY